MRGIIPGFCNACEGELTEYLPKVDDSQTGEHFAVRRCVRCGLGHTIPQPVDLAPYYGSVYYGGRHGFTNAHCIRRRYRIVASVLDPREKKQLLDVGCGDGTFLLAAKKRGWHVVGVEMNPDLARRAGIDVRYSIEEVSDSAPFDVITLWHSLEHMRNPKSALITLSRLLASNGRLIVAVPDANGLQARVFGKQWFHLDVPRHLYHFGVHSLTSLLHSCGFSVKRQWHQELEYDLLGWSQSALNLFFPVPDIFFLWLTRKLRKARREVGSGLQTMSIALGMAFSVLALPTFGAGTLLRHGGTIVIAAALTHECGC